MRRARNPDAKVIVDTSVQPLQKLLHLGLAHVQVISLSKYPSLGETIGGAVIGETEAIERTRAICTELGLVLPPESAGTLLRHLRTLDDRIASVSQKAQTVVAALQRLPFVGDIRIPDLTHVGCSPGGQITFRLPVDVARRAEEIVTANTLDEHFPLAFACTFGAMYTTFEHFVSRNVGERRTSEGSHYISEGVVRLGIGHEPSDRIVAALEFVLRAANIG